MLPLKPPHDDIRLDIEGDGYIGIDSVVVTSLARIWLQCARVAKSRPGQKLTEHCSKADCNAYQKMATLYQDSKITRE